MSKRGAKIFLLMQVFFVIFGFALFFGLKALKESRQEKTTLMTKVEKNDDFISVPSEKIGVDCSFLHWMGKPVNEEALKETGRPYRILPPGSMMTMDHNEQRINVHVDDNGIVTGLRCG